MGEIVFGFFLLLTVISAANTALSKNLIHSVFSLLATFFGIAGLYIFLYADFMAVAQIMVYVGGILVLLIFGVMLTQKINSVVIIHGAVNKIFAIILGLLLFGIILYTILQTTWYTGQGAQLPEATIYDIGNLLMGKYLLAFEVVSVLLLGALVGAATIARGDSE